MLKDRNIRHENNDVIQFLVKVLMNSLYGEHIRKNIEESFACKPEAWMMNEYHERVEDYWRISHGKYIVKMIDDKGLEDDCKKIKYHATSFWRFCIIE